MFLLERICFMNNLFLCRSVLADYHGTEQILRLSLSFLLDCGVAKFRKIIYFYKVLILAYNVFHLI